MRISENSFRTNTDAVIMYVDMNSFFASCEQQDDASLRGKPVGVTTYNSPNACVIAPSVEAKKFGVKTGMRLGDCKNLCPQIIPVTTRPVRYREIHLQIMEILHRYCTREDVLAKSIDEAVVHLTTYSRVYPEPEVLAQKIKDDIKNVCGEYIRCSIGIAPNTFLAKLGTELQKPDGLVRITPDNIDSHLKKLNLTDLPGIASSNERRLLMIGIKSPLEMRHASSMLLRKAFGGVVGDYWHARLNFKEVDFYQNKYRGMSAARTVSPKQRESKETLEALLISLCTKLEQRLVKQKVFCRELSFTIRYKDFTSWDTRIRFPFPVQDAMEMRRYIHERIDDHLRQYNIQEVFTNRTQNIGVAISSFVSDQHVQYSLFENRIRHDVVRKTMYAMKDRYGKNIVRKASETIIKGTMKDAIGFGSVKDLYEGNGNNFNNYLIEEDYD